MKDWLEIALRSDLLFFYSRSCDKNSRQVNETTHDHYRLHLSMLRVYESEQALKAHNWWKFAPKTFYLYFYYFISVQYIP